ncbi:putative secreted protein [Wickerhamomyces ciferrii]|uniref:Secreted protein n=1 Tax=Wickerhamomyces ciferrii (strain ATCC 14091 / BCRC 22168 / CBS 111 / JCM 3599 / NBRC 0793 / NRRL Y-1031 F-60-10) TaxID=1206466 RepID=K0KU76_WICCF|nr:uncharacterized protein BN7_6328 [Wickerhamomyces ciferrii]CCH46731.1 putative secreted protein [Wickerhamomyces ciferrii]
MLHCIVRLSVLLEDVLATGYSSYGSYHPCELRDLLSGATGNSQVLTSVLAIAESNSWESFFTTLNKSVTFLFFIGVRCYQVYPNTTLPPSILQDSDENGEGVTYPMLSVLYVRGSKRWIDVSLRNFVGSILPGAFLMDIKKL